MQLSKSYVQKASGKEWDVYDQLFSYPEKVLQFGTGVLLRALPDYFIDKANRAGIFKGRIVLVKSTASDSSAFDAQNGLYTICVRGIEDGKMIQENIINTSISRVINANTEWDIVLQQAANPALQVIISNTTEMGLQLVEESIYDNPPASYPAKLLAFLYRRFQIFGSSPESSLVVIPTELVSDNGKVLKTILGKLIEKNQLESDFVEWVDAYVYFCNSLVDRIVPGMPTGEERAAIFAELGYEDELLTCCEVYRLWAIEGNETVKSILSFYSVDAGVQVVPDIAVFKELKLRLLNGTHTFNSATAFLSGFVLTRDAIANEEYVTFVRKLMHDEIAPSIPLPIEDSVKMQFAHSVIDRFRNPSISHKWQSVNVQISSKMKSRNIPLLLHFYAQFNRVPECMATGFAAYIVYMKGEEIFNNQFQGKIGEATYIIHDDQARQFAIWWKELSPNEVVETVLSNTKFWETDLTKLHGFLEYVQVKVNQMLQFGVKHVILELIKKENLYA
ncbi:MAG: tagaturonate reductase [Sediminibacterium sp.]|nr:tagaturonate reductase [Sediminibacterium sp.]